MRAALWGTRQAIIGINMHLVWVFFEEVRGGQESILSLRGLADFGDFGWRDHWSVIAESVPHVGQDGSDFFVVELPKGWRGK
jgi:hypothetical protein